MCYLIPHLQKNGPEAALGIGAIITDQRHDGVVVWKVKKVGTVSKIPSSMPPGKIGSGIANVDEVLYAGDAKMFPCFNGRVENKHFIQ